MRNLRSIMERVASPLHITRSTGEQEPFDPQRLRRSLEHAGATPDVSERIAGAILPWIAQGMSTRKIYRKAFNLLSQRSKRLAARYSLKQAIMDLGPSGFPFERFIARILEKDGYRTQVGVILAGKCVDHEVDVVAERNGNHFLIECKYHNSHGRFCDVKVPLYINSRFADIAAAWREDGGSRKFDRGWVITNTRFTSDAMKYGECAGLRMIGWDQPARGSLKERIDRSGLYPVTCMLTLSKAEKTRLLEKDVVLASEIIQRPDLLSHALVRPEKTGSILREAEELTA